MGCKVCHGEGEIMADNTGEWHRCPVCKKGGVNTRPLPRIKRKINKEKLRRLLDEEE